NRGTIDKHMPREPGEVDRPRLGARAKSSFSAGYLGWHFGQPLSGRDLLHFRSPGGTADPPCRMDHVDEGRSHLFPLTGLEAAVRIDPYLIGRKTLLRLIEKCRHLVDAWTTRRMNVVNARSNFVRIAIGSEGIEELHLG